MLKRLNLQYSAYFYKAQNKLTPEIVKEVFDYVSRNAITESVYKTVGKKNINGKKTSLLVFSVNNKPSFLIRGKEIEKKYAYLLLIEYKGFIIVSAKNVSGWKMKLVNHIEDIDYRTITRFSLKKDTRYEKYTMLNMDISDAAIRRKSVEAVDLNGTYSLYGSNKYMLQNIRHKSSHGQTSIMSSTSHIVELGKKGDIGSFRDWVATTVDQILQYEPESTVLDNFAIPQDIKQKIKIIEPTCILFTLNNLVDELSKGTILNPKYKNKTINLSKYLTKFNEYAKVSEKAEGIYDAEIDGIRGGVTLKKMKNNFKIMCHKLKDITFELNGETDNLQDYINESKAFILLFDDPTCIFYNNKLFIDSGLLGHIENYLDIFVPYEELNSDYLKKITSEKAHQNNIQSSSGNQFDDQSLFGFIENKLAADCDFLVCDDLGDEWADYISIDVKKEVSFYHAKYFKSTHSASDFHEVASQAQKNIGNIFNLKKLPDKTKKWVKNYPQTSMARIRKDNNSIAVNIANEYENLLRTPNVKKNVMIVINNFSKKELESQLNLLKNDQKSKNQTIQILWLISSLVHSCTEASLNLIICCAE